jgi:transposase
MSLYIGVDFHPHQQTVCWGDLSTGETQTLTLPHDLDKVREFYQSMSPAIVGIEATGKAIWFENLLAETKHQLLVGNPTLIRKKATSRHKSDKRDAELILNLLVKDEFPALWRRTSQNNQILEILKTRMNLVRQRTKIYNRLQALAHNFGLPKGRMRTNYFQLLIKGAKTDEAGELQRNQLFNLLEYISKQILELEEWLHKKAKLDSQVQLLLTQKGVGYLTALCLVNTIGEISRFDKPTKQVPAFIGIEPLGNESAGRSTNKGISRAGSWLARFLLGQSANIVARYDAKFKAFNKRLAKKKPKGVAKTATARKVLVKLVIMMRDKITASEFDRRGRTVNDTRRVQGLK